MVKRLHKRAEDYAYEEISKGILRGKNKIKNSMAGNLGKVPINEILSNIRDIRKAQ